MPEPAESDLRTGTASPAAAEGNDDSVDVPPSEARPSASVPVQWMEPNPIEPAATTTVVQTPEISHDIMTTGDDDEGASSHTRPRVVATPIEEPVTVHGVRVVDSEEHWDDIVDRQQEPDDDDVESNGASLSSSSPTQDNERHDVKSTTGQICNRWHYVAAILILVSIAVVVPVAVVLTRDRDDSNDDSSISGLDSQATATATVSTSTPTASPTSRLDSILSIVSTISFASDLNDETSSQYRALEWIANEDGAQLSPERDGEYRVIQRYVSAVLYFSTGGDEEGLWTNDYNFLTDKHECDWTDGSAELSAAVKSCDPVNRTITIIDFADNGLVGTIPPELGALTTLERLRFLNNADLYGPIPTQLGQLTDLNFLSLVGNNLSGHIPSELGRLDKVQGMWLHRNNLTGPIPSTLGSLSSALWVWVHDNHLTGVVPQSFVGLASATDIWANNNNLTGSVNFLCDALNVTLHMDKEKVECKCCACGEGMHVANSGNPVQPTPFACKQCHHVSRVARAAGVILQC